MKGYGLCTRYTDQRSTPIDLHHAPHQGVRGTGKGTTPTHHDSTERVLPALCRVIARECRGHALEAWMAEATHSGIDELARFARGPQGDLSAITSGLTLEWRNGAAEGQIHRLKLVKRQGSGRAGFALLRQRLLRAA
jgi:Transposase